MRQGNVREINFFPGQGIVREFCFVSGKFEKCQGILYFVRDFLSISHIFFYLGFTIYLDG